MLGKLIVQGISGLLLLSAVSLFFTGAQAGALREKSFSPAPVVAIADAAPQSAPLDLF